MQTKHEGVNWIDLAQNRFQWKPFLKNIRLFIHFNFNKLPFSKLECIILIFPFFLRCFHFMLIICHYTISLNQHKQYSHKKPAFHLHIHFLHPFHHISSLITEFIPSISLYNSHNDSIHNFKNTLFWHLQLSGCMFLRYTAIVQWSTNNSKA